MEFFSQAYHFLSQGGPAMIVLLLGSIICAAFVIDRLSALQEKKILPQPFMRDLEELAKEQNPGEALAFCKAGNNPVGRIAAAGLDRRGKTVEQVREALEMAGRREVSNMEKRLETLSTLATAAPLIGLLGTVTGMIKTFSVVKAFGVGDPMRLSGGISEALVSTAAGLVLALPALIFHRYFMKKIDHFILDIEEYIERILHHFMEGK